MKIIEFLLNFKIEFYKKNFSVFSFNKIFQRNFWHTCVPKVVNHSNLNPNLTSTGAIRT